MSDDHSYLPSSFEKFDGTNYFSWSFILKTILEEGEVWDVIAKPKPSILDADATAAWLKKDRKAFTTITLATKPSYMQDIRHAKTAKEAWDNMSERYQSKGLMRRVLLKRKFNKMVMEEGENMEDHRRQFKDILDELNESGMTVDDQEAAIMLLSSLPKSWDSIITPLEHRIIQNLSFHDVATILKEENDRRK